MSRRKLTAQAALSSPVGILVRDTSSTTGAGLAGLTHTTPGLILEYRREGQSTWTQLGVGTGLVAGTLGTFTSGGIVADGALAGAYEIGIPNAAFAVAAGVRWVKVRLRGATNMLPVLMEFELDLIPYQSATLPADLVSMNSDPEPVDRLAGFANTLDPGGQITSLSILASALNGKGDWPVGKTGYELTAAERNSIRNVIEASTILARELTVLTRLAPTVAGRTVDVSVGGGVGLDWSNVESQGANVNLNGTNIGSSSNVQVGSFISLSSAGTDIEFLKSGRTAIESKVDTLLSRITSTLFAGVTSFGDWIRRIARKDTGTAGMATAQNEINTGGTSTFNGPSDSLESIRDNAGGGGGGGTVNITVEDRSITVA